MSSNIQSKQSNKAIQLQNQKDKPIVNVNSKSIGTNQNQPVLGSNISTSTSTSTPRIPSNKKTSHKNKNKTQNGQPKQQSKTKPIVDTIPKVSFNFKNNHVDKFYCKEMAIAKLTKTGPIDLESIPNLPEIPLEQLFGAQ